MHPTRWTIVLLPIIIQLLKSRLPRCVFTGVGSEQIQHNGQASRHHDRPPRHWLVRQSFHFSTSYLRSAPEHIAISLHPHDQSLPPRNIKLSQDLPKQQTKSKRTLSYPSDKTLTPFPIYPKPLTHISPLLQRPVSQSQLGRT